MKITRIQVKKLFGIFDHDIPLKTEDHITIIHGPNGYGKTILLTMVYELFNSNYWTLFRIPFSQLTIYFDDNSSLTVDKETDSLNKGKPIQQIDNSLVIKLLTPSSKSKSFQVKFLRKQSTLSSMLFVYKIKEFSWVNNDTWQHSATGENLTLDEILNRYNNALRSRFYDIKIERDDAWFNDLKDLISLHFIETQRIHHNSKDPLSTYQSTKPLNLNEDVKIDEAKLPEPVVLTYSIELAGNMRSKLAEYGSLSQSLDRTFPTRFVKQKSSEEITIDYLRKELIELEEKRSLLIDAGFLDQEKEEEFKELRDIDSVDIDPGKINVLYVYIEDVKKKLGVFDDLYKRIDLLVKIINNKFLYKKLSINRRSGFIFTGSDGEILPINSLSSGEQHELVMLYEMLFKVKPNTLFLIDEPEISLHIAWQGQFLKDLSEITTLVGFDALIATHSPDIINDRWDLTVELKGPEK